MEAFTAAELADMVFPAPTLGELVDMVDAGVCTPQCLFGTESGTPCSCRCGERYHGYARAKGPAKVPPPDCCNNCGPVKDGRHQVGTLTHWEPSEHGGIRAFYGHASCGHAWFTSWSGSNLITVREFDERTAWLTGDT